MSPACRLAAALALLALGAAASCDLARREPAAGPATARGEENRTVQLPVPEDPTITFKVWFQVGSADDPPGKEGLAYLTAQLLSQGGTTRNSYEAILEKLYPLASSYDVRVDREMTVLTGRTHRDNFTRFFELMSEAYLMPAFGADDFGRVKTDTLNYLKNSLRYESDEELAKAALTDFAFAGTRYAHPPQGTIAGVEGLTPEDVRAFYGERYTRGNTVVALGGSFDPALLHSFEQTLARLPAGEARRQPPPTPPPIAGREVLLVAKPDADASISLGFPIRPLRGERDFYALWVANSWLGEHRNSSSHLFQVIRETRGLNYGDYSYIEAYPEGGRRQVPPSHVGRRRQLFEIWIRTLPNENAHFALRAGVRELERLAAGGLTQEQFELTRSFLRKYVLHFADSTAARLAYAVDDRFYGLDEPHLTRFRRMLDELTVEDVNAAVREHLRPADMKIAIVTGEAEALRTALGADTPSPITYPSPKAPAVLEEDRVIATYPLRIAPAAIRVVPVDQMFAR